MAVSPRAAAAHGDLLHEVGPQVAEVRVRVRVRIRVRVANPKP